MDTPYEKLVLGETSSTQDEVWHHLDREPVLVVAERQASGRGRAGTGWENAPRALATSLGLCPDWPEETWSRLTLVAGVAALRSLEGHAEGLSLKWPNDVMRGPSKLGGILTEARGPRVVVGWGANLYWPDPPAGRGALYPTDPGPSQAVLIADRWAHQFLRLVAAPHHTWPRQEYRLSCSTLGRQVRWQPAGAGRAVDVSEEGGLVVETPQGRVTLMSGEVYEIRHRLGGGRGERTEEG